MNAGTNPVIALSNELDHLERLVDQAYRDGYAAGEEAHKDDYQRGQIVGAGLAKRTEHELTEQLELEARRWPRGREHHGEPQPGDYPGGVEGPAKVQASWIGQGLDLGPGPGWVHLGGPTVHHHRCEPVCYDHKPGWYTLADAIEIIEKLPGDYAASLADLRERLTRAQGSVAA